jgi:hypothetical protein
MQHEGLLPETVSSLNGTGLPLRRSWNPLILMKRQAQHQAINKITSTTIIETTTYTHTRFFAEFANIPSHVNSYNSITIKLVRSQKMPSQNETVLS